MEKKFLLQILIWMGENNFTTSSVIIDEDTATQVCKKYNKINEGFYVSSMDSALEFWFDGISNIMVTEINDVEAYVLDKFGYISLDKDNDVCSNYEFALEFIKELINYDNDLDLNILED